MSSPGKPPKAPDPQQMIELQNQYNRYNQSSPFGSTSWSSGGPGGHETQTTTPSDQMQGSIDRAFQLSATPSTQMYVPQGMDQLASGVLGKVGSHYGMGGQGQSPLNTNLKQPYQAPPQMQQGMAQMPNLNGMQGGAPGTLGSMGGMPQGGSPMGQLGGQFGNQTSMGGMGGMSPQLLMALRAMQGGGGGGSVQPPPQQMS